MVNNYRILIIVVISINLFNLNGQSRFGVMLDDYIIHSSISKSGTLYAGIDNPLSISKLFNLKYDSIVLNTNNGSIFFDRCAIIVPARAGTARITIEGLKNDSVVFEGFTTFIVSPLPQPKIIIDTLQFDGMVELTKNFILKADSINVIYTSDIPSSINWLQVKEYTIGYRYGGVYIESSYMGNLLNNETKSFVNEIRPNQYVHLKVITKNNKNIVKHLPVARFFIY